MEGHVGGHLLLRGVAELFTLLGTSDQLAFGMYWNRILSRPQGCRDSCEPKQRPGLVLVEMVGIIGTQRHNSKVQRRIRRLVVKVSLDYSEFSIDTAENKNFKIHRLLKRERILTFGMQRQINLAELRTI